MGLEFVFFRNTVKEPCVSCCYMLDYLCYVSTNPGMSFISIHSVEINNIPVLVKTKA